MKNFIGALLLLVFFGSIQAKAQSLENPGLPKNEVKLNIFNTIINGSLELGYEHFLDQNQSIGFGMTFMDRFAYVGDGGDGKDFQATSATLSYNYYFVTESNPSGIYVFPFLKYKGGSFTEVLEDVGTVETSMNSFIIGFGAGYKWVHNDKFALGPYVSLARGFNDEVSDRFEPVEFNGGFTIGFRF